MLRASINYSRTNESALNLEAFIWYNLRDISLEGRWDDYCGLRDHSGNYRLAWYAFQEETGAGPWPTAPTAENRRSARQQRNQRDHPRHRQSPRGATTHRFECGTTNAYGHSAPIPAGEVGSGGEAVALSQTITSLVARTHYHYRIVATNSFGAVYGGDRTFTTGVKWMIRNSNSGGAPEASYWFGLPGQIQVVGDWNGNGIETSGTYEPSTGTWRLRNSNTSGPAEIEFQ